MSLYTVLYHILEVGTEGNFPHKPDKKRLDSSRRSGARFKTKIAATCEHAEKFSEGQFDNKSRVPQTLALLMKSIVKLTSCNVATRGTLIFLATRDTRHVHHLVRWMHKSAQNDQVSHSSLSKRDKYVQGRWLDICCGHRSLARPHLGHHSMFTELN